MDANSTKFDTGVMQLASPQEGLFTKAGEGISSIGNIMQAQENNAVAQNLAQQKNTRENETFLQTSRKNRLDEMKSSLDLEGQTKAFEESGIKDKLVGMLPTSDFMKNGTIDINGLENARKTFLNSPKWEGNEHIVNNIFDQKLKDLQGINEGDLKNRKLGADIYKTQQEGAYVAPKALADIAQSKASAANSYASANRNNIEASLAPKEFGLKQQRLNFDMEKGDGINTINPEKLFYGRKQDIAMGRMKNLVPGYDALEPSQQSELNSIYLNKGTIPEKIRPLTDEEKKEYSEGFRAVFKNGEK
jgi:hypothetical protein